MVTARHVEKTAREFQGEFSWGLFRERKRILRNGDRQRGVTVRFDTSGGHCGRQRSKARIDELELLATMAQRLWETPSHGDRRSHEIGTPGTGALENNDGRHVRQKLDEEKEESSRAAAAAVTTRAAGAVRPKAKKDVGKGASKSRRKGTAMWL